MAELLAALRSNTKSNVELAAEVRRLADNFSKVITAPPQRIEDRSGATVDLGDVAGKATVAALGALFGGSGRRKK
jgi:hypothetical protein